MFHGTTLKSWQVIDDCDQAITSLEHSDEQGPWRVHYVAAITLLRAVGHVLINTDARENPVLATRLRLIWADIEKDKKLHKIFWNFIKPERDRVLKEYCFATIGFDRADPAILRLTQDGTLREWGEEEKTLYLNSEAERNSDMSLPIDAPGLLREALSFWLHILYDLEFYIYPYSDWSQ